MQSIWDQTLKCLAGGVGDNLLNRSSGLNDLEGWLVDYDMNLLSLLGKSATSQPVEVGVVDWLRDLDEALDLSKESGKPIFALFQEVPGCSGCKQFGKDVLSNRVVVDGIEEAFVPLLIHNNTPGRDAQVLQAFGEPAWNYQVVRFLDENAEDIIPRKDRVWETGPLVDRMIETLEKSDRPIPSYLRLIEQENSDRLELAHLAQACFWVGEMEIGQIDGVVATQAAFMGGHEVTSVWFDPEEVSLLDLSLQAQQRGVASVVFTDEDGLQSLKGSGVNSRLIEERTHRVAPKSDQKRQVKRVSGLGGLSISQLTKVNGFMPRNLDRAAEFLPPSERGLLARR